MEGDEVEDVEDVEEETNGETSPEVRNEAEVEGGTGTGEESGGAGEAYGLGEAYAGDAPLG